VVIPLLVFLIPIHVIPLGLVLTVMTVMGVTNHMGWELFPRFMYRGAIGQWLITASHHQRHHDLYACNYGLYFTVLGPALRHRQGAGQLRKACSRRPRWRCCRAMVPAPDNSLEVHVGGLRSTKGIIRFCVTTEAKSFPDCKTGKVFTRSVPAATPHVRFDDLPAGDYAVAVIHDENGNAKLDTFMGIPAKASAFRAIR
jgi:hypothetical protein